MSDNCQVAIQESLFPDIENLPVVAVELVQAGIDRKMALRIAEQEWDFVNLAKLPSPGSYADFLGYVAEKIGMSVDAASVKNRAGYIVEAIRENYQDPELQKQRQIRAEKAKEKELEDLTTKFNAKRNTLLRQAFHAEPELIERAAERIHSHIIRQRLEAHDTALIAYQKGGWLPRRSMPSLRRSSVRTCWHRLLRRMRMRGQGYWNSCQGSAIHITEGVTQVPLRYP